MGGSRGTCRSRDGSRARGYSTWGLFDLVRTSGSRACGASAWAPCLERAPFPEEAWIYDGALAPETLVLKNRFWEDGTIRSRVALNEGVPL